MYINVGSTVHINLIRIDYRYQRFTLKPAYTSHQEKKHAFIIITQNNKNLVDIPQYYP